MDWIKRNLYFLIGSLVALALMGLAGWYLYSKWQLNNEILEKLDEQYAELKRLYETEPPSGLRQDGQHQGRQRTAAGTARLHPEGPPIFPAFSPHPRARVGQGDQPGIQLRPQPDYGPNAARGRQGERGPAAQGQQAARPTAFPSRRNGSSLAYAPGSLAPLSVQLGEVKAICAVLFAAKVNSLDSCGASASPMTI